MIMKAATVYMRVSSISTGDGGKHICIGNQVTIHNPSCLAEALEVV